MKKNPRHKSKTSWFTRHLRKYKNDFSSISPLWGGFIGDISSTKKQWSGILSVFLLHVWWCWNTIWVYLREYLRTVTNIEKEILTFYISHKKVVYIFLHKNGQLMRNLSHQYILFMFPFLCPWERKNYPAALVCPRGGQLSLAYPIAHIWNVVGILPMNQKKLR